MEQTDGIQGPGLAEKHSLWKSQRPLWPNPEGFVQIDSVSPQNLRRFYFAFQGFLFFFFWPRQQLPRSLTPFRRWPKMLQSPECLTGLTCLRPSLPCTIGQRLAVFGGKIITPGEPSQTHLSLPVLCSSVVSAKENINAESSGGLWESPCGHAESC